MTLVRRIRRARHVFLIGNGGSYANAQHIANDLIAVGVKAFTLDCASLTAIANDYGYETVFKRWIGTVGRKGDLLIALSGSGRSPNILAALAEARKKGMDAECITWYLKDGMDMQMSEETQLVLGHQWRKELGK